MLEKKEARELFEIGKLVRLDLGYQGENKARTIEIDMSAWLEEFPGAAVGLMVRRPGEDTFYPADLKPDGDIVRWTITSGDVEIAGEGEAQIILTNKDDVELRSRVVKTKISASLSGTEVEAPPPEQNWVGVVLQAAEKAKKQADRAEQIANDMSGGVVTGAVRYDAEQTLTEEEKARARKNIGADTGVNFTTDATLTLSEDGILSVNTADEVEKDNTLPVTSAAVYTEVGNINALLATI